MNGRGWTRGFLALMALTGACADADEDLARDDDAARAAQSATASTARVDLEDGSLDGVADGKTYKFLGIPYAKPPVGALRWKRPVKNDAWTTPRDASQFGKRCAQRESLVLQNAASEDEDCLYLNVWTPELAPAAKKPVMVFIHGGGNVNGSASEPLPYTDPKTAGLFYSGHKLAANDVVVVTFNYRLGVFGFFAHTGLGADENGGGNQGLFDQQRALAWVKQNIAKFGGDPENVTIFGESAGSQDVCLHVASPGSRGLFHRAISQSGGCSTLNPTKAQATQTGQKLADALGCSGPDALACLQAQPVSKLLAPGVQPALTFGPIVDGTFLPDQTRTLYTKGEIAKVPYILGSNTDEGTLFVGAVASEAALRATLAAQYGAASVEPILALYPLSKFASPRAAYARIFGDAALVCTTFDTATLAAQAGSKVWMYNFDIAATMPPGASTAEPLGATHGAELTYVFGTSALFTPASSAASALMQGYWTGFAKQGDPNGGDRLTWPAFSPAANTRVNFGLTPSIASDFRASECAFWRARYDAAFAAATR